MRRTLVILMMAATVGPAAAVPTTKEAQAAPVAVHRVDNLPDTRLRDEAAMVLIGTILIGLAAALRRVS